MIDGKFTAKERAYLASLPAVKSVSATHIRYTDRFRVEVMCRYHAGESPSAMFREAGLDPKLIGYKRVERCIARWKQQEAREARRGSAASLYLQDIDDPQIFSQQKQARQRLLRDAHGGYAESHGHANGVRGDQAVVGRGMDDPFSAGAASANASSSEDSQDALSKLAKAQLAINERDLLIARQALRIDELERVLRKIVK